MNTQVNLIYTTSRPVHEATAALTKLAAARSAGLSPANGAVKMAVASAFPSASIDATVSAAAAGNASEITFAARITGDGPMECYRARMAFTEAVTAAIDALGAALGPVASKGMQLEF